MSLTPEQLSALRHVLDVAAQWGENAAASSGEVGPTDTDEACEQIAAECGLLPEEIIEIRDVLRDVAVVRAMIKVLAP